MTDAVQPRPLTVEQGRRLLATARRFQVWERVGLGIMGVGILTFGISIVELRRIDTVTMAGGAPSIPYVAYIGIFLFWAGFALLWYMRSRVLHIHRMLDVEQKRRDAEAIAAQISEADGGAASSTIESAMPIETQSNTREE